MRALIAIIFCLLLFVPFADAGRIGRGIPNTNFQSGIGINSQEIGFASQGDAQAPLNALNAATFWQLFNGASATGEEYNLPVDQYGNIITFGIGWNGSALTATSASVETLCCQDPNYLYPGGNNSWEFLWTGAGTFTYGNDVTGTSSCGTNCTSLNVTPTGGGGGGIRLNITSTGVSSTVTFSGSTVSWTGSNFSAGTPVACRNGSGTLPTQITSLSVYYVVSPSTNSFSLASTVGGSPISFSGQSGNPTCYGNWARNMLLVPTQYVALAQSGELWNPNYIAFLKRYHMWRGMKAQQTYSLFEVQQTVTFAGTTVSISSQQFAPGTSVIFQLISGGTLPNPLVENQPYYVLAANDAVGSFQISSTIGGSPISFSGGSGTVTMLTGAPITANDYMPCGYLLWNGPMNNVGKGINGLPVCAMAALANEANIDIWFNFGPLTGTDYQTLAATDMHTLTNSNIHVNLEVSNEIWSFANNLIRGWGNGIGTLGTKLFPSAGVAGASNEYGVYKVIRDCTTWKTIWGTDASRISCVAPGQFTNNCFGITERDIPAFVDGGSNPITITSFSGPSTINVTNSYVAGQSVTITTTGTLPTGLVATNWTGIGNCSYVGNFQDYYVSSTGLTSSTIQVAASKADALNGVNSVTFSGSASGTATIYGTYWTGPAYTHFDATEIAPYFGGASVANIIPDACTASADGCRAEAYAEGSQGGVYLPLCTSVSGVASGCTYNTVASAVNASGGPTTYTVTSGQSLSCPPPNNTAIAVNFTTANGSSAVMNVDGCSTNSTLQDGHGVALGAGTISVNSTWALVYTSTVCQTFSTTGCSATTSVGTPGWRTTNFGFQGGWVGWTIGQIASAYTNVAQPRSLALVGYEGGQSLSCFNCGDTVFENWTNFFNLTPEMGMLYTQFVSQIPGTGMQIFNHYADISPTSGEGPWGIKNNQNAPDQPKNAAIEGFVAGQACWWVGCAH